MEQKRFINVYLSLGSNQGDRIQIIRAAEKLIDRNAGRIARKSSYYETAAWGNTDQPPFINCVLMINTTLSPRELLEVNQKIERELGREITGERWGPRLIDLDILFYGKRVIRDKGLDIPHPHFHNRRFVIVPMMEIAPDFEHPTLKLDMISMYENCEDLSEVVMIEVPNKKKADRELKAQQAWVGEGMNRNKPAEPEAPKRYTKAPPQSRERTKTTRTTKAAGGKTESGGATKKWPTGDKNASSRPKTAKPKSAKPKTQKPNGSKPAANRSNKPPKE